jgi:hypothetical protein
MTPRSIFCLPTPSVRKAAAVSKSPLELTSRLCVALAVCGCTQDVQNTNAQADPSLARPARVGFELVADAMQLHCGTLDCHGQIGRNMRLYGMYGLRASPQDDPLNQPTSQAEYDADYLSIVGLEPEAMSKVVRHQAAPETLSMIRKPLGIENHKGGQLMVQADPLDRCMVGWLVGSMDAQSCNTVVQTPRPPIDGGP